MRNFVLRFPEGKYKAMTFSYDDGVKSDLRLAELMKKNGVKGTFNLNTMFYKNTDAPEGHLTISEVRELANDPNFEIACHGDVHPCFAFMPQAAATDDIMKNRKGLEKMLGKIIRGFAYSSISAFNNISETALKAADIVYARLADNTKNISIPENWLRWMPTCHHNLAPELFEKFNSNVRGIAPLIFFVWGHSYEFDNDNNWDMIESFLEKCSQHKDIWFATNMEIYNYVEAFKSLIYSADGSSVHNPTAITLWGDLDSNKKTHCGKIIKIAPGETVELHL